MKNQNKFIFHSWFPIVIVFLLLISISCKKKQDDTPVPDKQVLMTINFTNNFINPKLGAIVFVSDAAGNSLADTSVTGNPRLVLSTSKTSTPPYQVTIATWDPDMHNFLVTINTYTHVLPSEWTFRGNRLVSTGDASYSLTNVPQHSDLILYSSSGYSNLTFADAGSLPVYKSPDSLYIKLNGAAGPMYKWKSGLAAGASLEIDLTTMQAAETRTISLPVTAQDFLARVSGYNDTSNYSALMVTTDEVLGDGTAKDKIVVSYPPSAFANFHTYLELVQNWDSASTYTYSKFGPIPGEFVKTGAVISGIHPSAGSVRFSVSGSYTETKATWHFQDADYLAFAWTVHGPDTVTLMTLPALPKSMSAMFPTLSLDSMQLTQMEQSWYPAATSYRSYLDVLFDPLHPGKGSYLEASSVRIMVE